MVRHLKQPAQTYAAHTYPLPAQQLVPQSYADHQAYQHQAYQPQAYQPQAYTTQNTYQQQTYAAQNTYQPQAYTAQNTYQQQPKDRPSKHPRNHRWRAATFVLLCLVICAALGAGATYAAHYVLSNQSYTSKEPQIFKVFDILKPKEKTPEPPGAPFQSKSIYVYNLTDNCEVKNLNADAQLPPASLTKIMTVYTALQYIRNLDAKAPIDTASYAKLDEQNASTAGFVAGEQTTFRDLLYGTMLRSGAECAISLAVNTAGSEDAFVAEMNKNAQKMGLRNTHFANTTGLDDNSLMSTAHEIGQMLSCALKNETFRKIFCTASYDSSKTDKHPKGITIKSTVLSHLTPDEQQGFTILGGKSGTTDNAGLCWATLVEKNKKHYIVVTMGAPYTDINNQGSGQKDDTITAIQTLIP